MLQKDGWSQKVINKELYTKVQPKRNLLQEMIQRKLQPFGHICRKIDSQKIKLLIFGIMYINNNSIPGTFVVYLLQ